MHRRTPASHWPQGAVVIRLAVAVARIRRFTHVAIHITRPNPAMAPGPEGFFASLHHLTQMLTGHHARGVVCLDVPGQPSLALANCNACHPTISHLTQRSAMPADPRTNCSLSTPAPGRRWRATVGSTPSWPPPACLHAALQP